MLTAGLVFALVRGHLRAGEASQAAVSITDRIELGELDRAERFIKSLEKSDPGLLGYPPMIEARQRFEAAQSQGDRPAAPIRRRPARGRTGPAGHARAKVFETPRSLARSETEKQAIASSSSNGRPPSRPSASSRRRPSGRGSRRSARGSARSIDT